ncbi:hypothetical protein BH23ACT9_BH23ACT9_04470 [soil metagenome]
MTNSSDALSELARVLGAEPPASLDTLDPGVLSHLTEAVLAESRRQEQALGAAVDNALRLIPRPLRGVVKRLITP